MIKCAVSEVWFKLIKLCFFFLLLKCQWVLIPEKNRSVIKMPYEFEFRHWRLILWMLRHSRFSMLKNKKIIIRCGPQYPEGPGSPCYHVNQGRYVNIFKWKFKLYLSEVSNQLNHLKPPQFLIILPFPPPMVRFG